MIDDDEKPQEETNDDLETVASGTDDDASGELDGGELNESEGEESEVEGEEETVVSFGGDDGDDSAGGEGESGNNWVKELRQKNRDQNKRIKHLEQEREQYVQPPTQLGERPTLEDADYDAEVYESNLTGWLEQKRNVEQEQWQHQQSVEEHTKAWETRRGEYVNAQDSFEKTAYTEAEETVQTALNDEQQYLVVHLAGKNAAAMVMGLSKNVKQMQELAAIKDRDLFSAAIGRLENKMTISKRKPKTEPETRINTGGGGVTGSSHLEELRKKAAKTGDLTEVLKYKKQLRENAA